MTEEFKEENIQGELIDEEKEGARINLKNLMRNIARRNNNPQNNNPQNNNPQNNQIRQLKSEITLLQQTINKKDNTIRSLNNQNAYCKTNLQSANKKLNSSLDNLQYFRTSMLGNDEVDGCATALTKLQIKYNELQTQEIGKPLIGNQKKEGFESLYKSILPESNNIKNELEKVVEGLDDNMYTTGLIRSSSNSPDAYVYNTIYTQNKSIDNQIDQTKSTHSINDQISANTLSRTEYFKKINKVLTFFFMGACFYAFYKLYKIPTMSIQTKLLYGLLVILSMFIIHSIEYFFVKTIPFIWASITGVPYRPMFTFSAPDRYDYLPSK